jgi:hypothetical protein
MLTPGEVFLMADAYLKKRLGYSADERPPFSVMLMPGMWEEWCQIDVHFGNIRLSEQLPLYAVSPYEPILDNWFRSISRNLCKYSVERAALYADFANRLWKARVMGGGSDGS